MAVAHYSFGRRGSRVGAALLAIAVFGSLALPVAARGPGGAVPLERIAVGSYAERARPVAGPRVVMLLLDGASLEYVWPRAAGGRLPNFARLLERGASMDLATVRPTRPDPVWAAVATGMYPREERRALARPRTTRAANDAPIDAAARLLFLSRAGPPRVVRDATELVGVACAPAPLGHPRRHWLSRPASCAGR